MVRTGSTETSLEPGAIATRFLAAFASADIEAMEGMLDEALVAYITAADGRTEKIEGRGAYLSRIKAMDLPSARFSAELTQPPLRVDGDRVLLMVEIRAERGGRSLHNFAAHLLRVSCGRITESRMVDAKPAESAAFWA